MRQLLSAWATVLTAIVVLPGAASADGYASFASCKWHVVTSPNPLSDQNYLGSVSATSKNNAWAFGNATGAATVTLAEGWDGHAWSISPTSNPSGGLYDSFNGGVAISPTDVWGVGATYNGNTGLFQTLAEHWNGSAWTVVPTPNVSGVNNQLYGIAADGTNDVWAVGIYRVAPGVRANLVEHWNGSVWSIVTSPNKGAGDNAIGSVIAFAPNAAFADGGYNSPNAKTLIEGWNGTKWSIAKSKNANTNSNIFNVITGVGPADVWALGDYSTGTIFNSLAEHWNGTKWQLIPSANMGTDFTAIFGGTAVTAGDAWGVGLWSDGSNNFPYTMNWNGTTWSSVNTPNIGPSGGIFAGASAIPGTSDVWAVGATDNANATPHLTLIEKFHC